MLGRQSAKVQLLSLESTCFSSVFLLLLHEKGIICPWKPESQNTFLFHSTWIRKAKHDTTNKWDQVLLRVHLGWAACICKQGSYNSSIPRYSDRKLHTKERNLSKRERTGVDRILSMQKIPGFQAPALDKTSPELSRPYWAIQITDVNPYKTASYVHI